MAKNSDILRSSCPKHKKSFIKKIVIHYAGLMFSISSQSRGKSTVLKHLYVPKGMRGMCDVTRYQVD